MANIKQCDRCKIMRDVTQIRNWKEIVKNEELSGRSSMSIHWEICEDCDKDFNYFMSNIHDVKPRKYTVLGANL